MSRDQRRYGDGSEEKCLGLQTARFGGRLLNLAWKGRWRVGSSGVDLLIVDERKVLVGRCLQACT